MATSCPLLLQRIVVHVPSKRLNNAVGIDSTPFHCNRVQHVYVVIDGKLEGKKCLLLTFMEARGSGTCLMLCPKQANMKTPTLKIEVNVQVSGNMLSLICGLIQVRVTAERQNEARNHVLGRREALTWIEHMGGVDLCKPGASRLIPHAAAKKE